MDAERRKRRIEVGKVWLFGGCCAGPVIHLPRRMTERCDGCSLCPLCGKCLCSASECVILSLTLVQPFSRLNITNMKDGVEKVEGFADSSLCSFLERVSALCRGVYFVIPGHCAGVVPLT